MRLKRFNKNKSLRNQQLKQNKSAYIKNISTIFSVLIIIFTIAYFSFARFEENSESFAIINATVGEFHHYYTLTLNPNSGNITSNEKQVARYYPIGTLETPTRTGYSFNGWYYSNNQPVDTTKEINGDTTIIAHWTPNTYTVNFYSNPYQIYNQSLLVTLNGRTFTKTNVGNALVGYAYGGSFTGPILTSITEGSVFYTTYDINDGNVYHGSLGSMNINGLTYYYCSNGYWFAGNVTSTNGIANKKYVYSQYTTAESTIQQQQKAATDLVNDSKADKKTQSFTYDVAQNLSPNTYTRSGYTFQGWSTSPTGNVVYSNNQNVSNLISSNNGSIDLYAIWR